MRELNVIPEESTPGSLVLRPVDHDPDAGDGEQFFLAVDDALRAVITGSGDDTATEGDGRVSRDTGSPATPAGDAPQAPRTTREPDPRLSAPLTMSPRDIQARIRGGANITELAAECGVPESRIEPFAHPVLLERGRIADMAKQAHPVRDDGPAPLTLWEVLATALAARGDDLGDSEWDAYREAGGQWVILVTWLEGQTRTTAEWSYHRQGISNATAVARNSVAAALLDPNFGRPTRPLNPVREPDDGGDQGHSSGAPATGFTDRRDDGRGTVGPGTPQPDGENDEFLRHPDEDPQRRPRRRAITPHWEDVLLGVRTNTKRPRN
ncbi:septation protein SepH [Corynebacterium sp. P5875]|uniref:Septation protein SepH n=1 Tax=Corynebacterium antarcticum TaxID=2800405 RepID=A0A9Q4CDZ4_9CORY|nr:septation protein SepH [Corynebacterium antarcticum]MCX7538655.1 septation protein SepH [Corynebacterium antarcticum]